MIATPEKLLGTLHPPDCPSSSPDKVGVPAVLLLHLIFRDVLQVRGLILKEYRFGVNIKIKYIEQVCQNRKRSTRRTADIPSYFPALV